MQLYIDQERKSAMSQWKEVKPENWKESVFEKVGKQWMLVTAKKEDGSVNTMTASWGGLGILWGKPVAFVFIRPQRYTKEFVDGSQSLSLSFLGEEYRKQLNYLGTVSGRDEDKIARSGLTVANEGDTPYFAESQTALICRKLYAQELTSECFTDKELDQKVYPGKDYHTMYVCEVEKILEA